MKIFIIHDFRRPDTELNLCMHEMQQQSIDLYVIWPGVISGHTTVEGCINASHKDIVANAKRMDLPEVCIMESDVWFPAPDGWEYFLKNKPDKSDIYTAAVYASDMAPLRALSDWSRGHAYRVDRIAGFHCYIISSSYYDQFLATPEEVHIDIAQTSNNLYVCYPFAALQRPSWSANHCSIQDYNGELTKSDVYPG